MTHPAAEYRNEVAQLKQELAELRAEMRAQAPAKAYVHPAAVVKPATREEGLPVGTFRDVFGMLRRSSDGSVWVDPAIAADPMAWQRKRWAEQEAAQKALQAKEQARADAIHAKQVDPHERELRQIYDAQAKEHRDWKIQNGVPVRPIPGEDA